MRRVLLGILLAFCSLFCSLEFLLRTLDPWGVHYFTDQRILRYNTASGNRVPLPGHYEFTDFEVVILEDTTRAVPATNPTANCTIAAIGDSVTFGWGVNDADTWVNVLAREFPDVHFLNAGISGYASDQVLWRKRQLEADGYLYLVWENDAEIHPQPDKGGAQITWKDFLYVELYAKLYLRLRDKGENVRDMARFWHDLEAIQDNRTLLIYDTRRNYRGSIAGNQPQAVAVEWQDYTPLSVADKHPDPTSHAAFARLILPYVQDFVDKVCNGQ